LAAPRTADGGEGKKREGERERERRREGERERERRRGRERGERTEWEGGEKKRGERVAIITIIKLDGR